MATVCSEVCAINYMEITACICCCDMPYKKFLQDVNRYSCYWIRLGSFTDHVKLRKSGEWGTQVELQLASDIFQIPVYISAPASEDFYRWNVFKLKELNIYKYIDIIIIIASISSIK